MIQTSIHFLKEIYNINIKNLERKMNKLFQVKFFVYIKTMQFPNEQFFTLSIVTKNFFSNVINIMEGKTHLHHLHVTGKIHGYLDSFCNINIRENKDFFSLFAHNFFGFHFFCCQRN